MPQPHDEALYPHSPDVLERETADEGFSAGWGLHHQPCETYIINCHTHMRPPTNDAGGVQKAVDDYYLRAGAMRLRRHVAMDGKPDTIDAFSAVSENDDRFLWMVWPHHDKPAIRFLKEASARPGFAGLKLHNHNVIRGGVHPGVWQTSEWDEIFQFMAEQRKPVLWHVTQRLTAAPYMGGGQNSYWKDGWPRGVTYGNRELLDVFQDVVSRHRGTMFIGAHHLHIGPEYLDGLFEEHPNLCADMSCGNLVRDGDEMYENDRTRWRDHLMKHQDRLLFGTDCILGAAGVWYLWESLAAHIRFLHQVRLPESALNKIAAGNFERLAGLQPVALKSSDWQAVRP